MIRSGYSERSSYVCFPHSAPLVHGSRNETLTARNCYKVVPIGALFLIGAVLAWRFSPL